MNMIETVLESSWSPLSENIYFAGVIFNIFCQMKVVIPTTSCRHEKMVFSTPLSEYKVYEQNISEEKTSDKPFQVSNIICDGGYTCGQQLLTEVVEIVKKLLFWSFFLIFPNV